MRQTNLFEHFCVCGLSGSTQLASSPATAQKLAPSLLDCLPHVEDVKKRLPPQLATVMEACAAI
jgi:hypothetical protein